MLEKIYLELTNKNSKFKEQLLKLVDEYLDGFETEDGRIKKDFKKLSEFQNKMDELFKNYGIPFMAWMALSINKILKKAADNFKEDGAEFGDVEYIQQLLGIKDNKVIQKRNGQTTAMFALFSLAVIKLDIINKIQGAMLGDSRIKDFKPALRNAVSKKFNDFFEVNSVAMIFNTYNAANFFFAKKYDYKKFRYEGGLISDSRDFCVERDGHEFFIEDGKSWNEYEWKGKIPGVDFFVQVGGYNCRHWLVFLKE